MRLPISKQKLTTQLNLTTFQSYSIGDQSSDQPHTAEIKGLNGGSDHSCDQSSDN